MKLYEINSKKKYDFSCIYLWTNLVNGKKYVGQAQSFYNRMAQYRLGHYNKYMQSAIKKYGVENFDIIILEKDVSKDMLDEREQYWLDYYKSYDKDYGYNICQFASTTRGYKHTQESKDLMSKIVAQRFSDPNERAKLQGVNNGMYGKKHTSKWRKEHSQWLKEKWANDDDYREFWQNKMKGENNYFYDKHLYGSLNGMYGKHHSEATKEKLSQKNGKKVRCVETGIVYPSITKAAQSVGVTRCVVAEAIKKFYRAGGYHWELVNS